MVFLLRQICKSQSNYFLPKSYIFHNIFKILVGEKPYMGQVPQDGNFAQNVALFFKK